jgi:hypothetical protein
MQTLRLFWVKAITCFYLLTSICSGVTAVNPFFERQIEPYQSAIADSFTVYIFLLEDCTISQNCTAALRQLHKKYASESIQFVGLFPNRFSKKRSIRRFRKKYQIPFELRQDPHQAMARRVGATITPEVAVWNKGKDELVYLGRVDDTYAALGQRRTTATSHDLRDALQAIKEGRVPTVQRTKPVGCFIEFE